MFSRVKFLKDVLFRRKQRTDLNVAIDENIQDIVNMHPYINEVQETVLPDGHLGHAVVNFDKKSIALYICPIDRKHISFDNFVQTLVTLHHESRHISQYESMFDGTAADDIVYSHFASYDNPDYYAINYKCDCSEIEAEAYGVWATYNYLINSMPDVDAFDAVSTYIRNRKANNDVLYHFVDTENICDIDGINDAFNKAYALASVDHTYYFIDRTNDSAARYMSTHRNVFSAFLDMNSKFEKDKLLTAIHMQSHPDHKYIVDNNPNVDISEFDEMFPHRDYPYNSETMEDSDDFHL